MTFKDFPIANDYPNIMKRSKFHQYLRDYADHFSLYDFVKFNTTVSRVQLAEDSDRKFKVTSVPANTNDGADERVDYCDYVVVCNGHHSVPLMPDFEGEREFEGTLMHVHSLREFDRDSFDDKNILIVGGSLSG